MQIPARRRAVDSSGGNPGSEARVDDADRAEERKIEGQRERERESEKRERERETVQEDEKEELGRVGMGGWLNFSSDHVEPIKADHGTQPPPPTSSTFFVLSLFLPRVLAFIHPPPRGERERGKEKERSLSRMPFPSRSRASPLSTTPVPVPTLLARASSFHLVFLLLPRPLTHSGNSLDFFASRGGVIYLAEVERHPRRWSTKRARGLGCRGEGIRGRPRENRWRRGRGEAAQRRR